MRGITDFSNIFIIFLLISLFISILKIEDITAEIIVTLFINFFGFYLNLNLIYPLLFSLIIVIATLIFLNKRKITCEEQDFKNRKNDIKKIYFVLLLPYTAYIFITTIALDDTTVLFPNKGIYLPLVDANIRPQDFAIFSTTIFFLLYIFLLWRVGNFVSQCTDRIKDNIEKNIFNIFKYNFLYLLFLGLTPLFLFLLIIWKFLKFQEFFFYYYFLASLSTIFFITLTIFVLATILIKNISFILNEYKKFSRRYKYKKIIPFSFLIFLFLVFDVAIISGFLIKNIETYKSLCFSLCINKNKHNEFFPDPSNKDLNKVNICDNNIKVLKSEDFQKAYPTLPYKSDRNKQSTSELKIFWKKISPVLSINGLQEAKVPDLKKIVDYFESTKKLTNNNHSKDNDIKFETLPIINIQNRSLQYANIKNIFIPKIRFYNVNFAYSKFKKVDFRDGWFELVSLNNATIEEGSIFNNSKFVNIVFKNANCENTKLLKSLIRNTIFEKTRLYKVNFKDAQLIDVEVSKSSSLENNNFSNTKITNLKIKNSELNNNNFSNSKIALSTQKLKEKELKNAKNFQLEIKNSFLLKNNFSHSIIKKLVIKNSELTLNNFDNSNQKISLDYSTFSGNSLKEGKISFRINDSKFVSNNFNRSQILNLAINNTYFIENKFINSQINNIDIKKSYLRDITFYNSTFSKNSFVSFDKSTLENVRLTKIKIPREDKIYVKVSNSILYKCNFWKSNFKGKKKEKIEFENSIIIEPMFLDLEPKRFKNSIVIFSKKSKYQKIPKHKNICQKKKKDEILKNLESIKHILKLSMLYYINQLSEEENYYYCFFKGK